MADDPDLLPPPGTETKRAVCSWSGGKESALALQMARHSTGEWYTAAIAGGAGFVAPWIVLVGVREWIASQPPWLVDLTIGIVLTTVATIFGLFHAIGLFGS